MSDLSFERSRQDENGAKLIYYFCPYHNIVFFVFVFVLLYIICIVFYNLDV